MSEQTEKLTHWQVKKIFEEYNISLEPLILYKGSRFYKKKRYILINNDTHEIIGRNLSMDDLTKIISDYRL